MDRFVDRIPSSTGLGLKRKRFDASPASKQDNNNNKKVSQKKEVTAKSKSCQMYLDFGQKSFGSRRQCPKCAMIYVIGDRDDEASHTKFCKSSDNYFKIHPSKSFRLLSSNSGDSKDKRTVYSIDGCKMWLVDGMKPILDLIASDLGANLEYIRESDDLVCYFLLLPDMTVAGCAMVESLEGQSVYTMTKDMTAADVLVSNHEQKHSGLTEYTSSRDEADNKELGQLSTHQVAKCDLQQAPSGHLDGGESSLPLEGTAPPDIHEAVVGIKQIWVHKNFRRQGIAQRLLDVVRQLHIFGRILARSDIAFSQPTSDGRKLALNYCGTEHVLVY